MTTEHEFVTVWNDSKTKQRKAYVLLNFAGKVYVEHPVYGDEYPIHVVNDDKTISCTGNYEISDIMDDIRYSSY